MKILILKALFLSVLIGFSQKKEYAPLPIYLENHQLTANLFAPGLMYEVAFIGSSTSLSTGFLPGVNSFSGNNGFGYAIQTRLRWYTNMKFRKKKKKNISGNSGDYIALANSVFFGNLQIIGNLESPGNSTFMFNGVLYGVQRTYDKRFNFNIEFGVGQYQGNGVENGIGPLINLNFGWVLTKKR